MTSAPVSAEADEIKAAKRAYQQQRSTAGLRGIAWDITFDEWWGIWQPYWHLRGRGKNGLCMARHGDAGPYSPSNVYLTTNLGNMKDYHHTERAALARQERKERSEAEFARRGPTWKKDVELLSHLAYKTLEGSRSTCNIVEDDVSS